MDALLAVERELDAPEAGGPLPPVLVHNDVLQTPRAASGIFNGTREAVLPAEAPSMPAAAGGDVERAAQSNAAPRGGGSGFRGLFRPRAGCKPPPAAGAVCAAASAMSPRAQRLQHAALQREGDRLMAAHLAEQRRNLEVMQQRMQAQQQQQEQQQKNTQAQTASQQASQQVQQQPRAGEPRGAGVPGASAMAATGGSSGGGTGGSTLMGLLASRKKRSKQIEMDALR
jgi:hypothetical protein